MMPICMISPMRQPPYATNIAAEQLRCASININAGCPGGLDFDQGGRRFPCRRRKIRPPPLRASGNMTMLMITIDGRTLSYDVSGAGPPIVFVAGLGEHGTYWMAQVAAFSSAFQVVTFDHGGVGASEGQPPYKVEEWGADQLPTDDQPCI